MNEKFNLGRSGRPGEGSRMTKLTEKRNLDVIAEEIRMYAAAGQRVTLLHAIQIGKKLAEAKEQLQHCDWLLWLQKETKYTEQQAKNYIRLFHEYGMELS